MSKFVNLLGFLIGVFVITYTLTVLISASYTLSNLEMNTCQKPWLAGCVCKGPYEDKDLMQLAADLDRCESSY